MNSSLEKDAAFALMQTLSDRERTVALALASEQAPKEIAGTLGIHPRTVAVYIERTRAKLGVASVVGIALIVQRSQ